MSLAPHVCSRFLLGSAERLEGMNSLGSNNRLVKDKVSLGGWIYLWAFYFVPLIYISVFVPVPYCVDDCGFVVEPEVRQVDSSSSILLSQDCFGYLRVFLYFHINCEIICCSSMKNTIGGLIEIALNLQIALGSILIFTVLILPIHEHGIFLHLLVSSFFHQCFIVFYI